MRQTPVATHHKDDALEKLLHRSNAKAGRRVLLGDCAGGVAGEEDGEVSLLGPRGKFVDAVGADGDGDDPVAIVEDRGVLIPVRLMLDGSALGSRLGEE